MADFWRVENKHRWPLDRTDAHLFILDALNRLGGAKYSTWDEFPDYFYRQPDDAFPFNMKHAGDHHRETAHQILVRSRQGYKPNYIEDGHYEGDEWHSHGTGHYKISADDWDYVRQAQRPPAPWDEWGDSYNANIKTFAAIISELVGALAKGELVSFAKAFGSGDFEVIPATHWNLDEGIIERFAFGEISLSGPTGNYWTNVRGKTHNIFILRSGFDSWLVRATAAASLVESPKTDKNIISHARFNQLVNTFLDLRQAGPQRTSKAAYLQVAVDKYDYSLTKAGDAWRLAARSKAPGWSASGRRKSSPPIDFELSADKSDRFTAPGAGKSAPR